MTPEAQRIAIAEAWERGNATAGCWRFPMIVRAELASWREPYWWVEDKAGFRYVMPVAIHRTTHADGGAVIWSIIVGPLCLGLKTCRTERVVTVR